MLFVWNVGVVERVVERTMVGTRHDYELLKFGALGTFQWRGGFE